MTRSPGGPALPDRLHQIYLEATRFAVAEHLGQFAASRTRYDLVRELDPLMLSHHLAAEILTASTGPRTYQDRRSASVDLVRFASWWDHFKATYRRRWWMRWRTWKVNYTLRTATAVAEIKVEASVAAVFPHAADLPETLGSAYPVVWVEPVRSSN